MYRVNRCFYFVIFIFVVVSGDHVTWTNHFEIRPKLVSIIIIILIFSFFFVSFPNHPNYSIKKKTKQKKIGKIMKNQSGS